LGGWWLMEYLLHLSWLVYQHVKPELAAAALLAGTVSSIAQKILADFKVYLHGYVCSFYACSMITSSN
jgi:hypothetical protein